MKKHYKIALIGIILTILVFLLSGCSHYNWIVKHKTEVQDWVCAPDSVNQSHISTIKIDTIIKRIPGDTFMINNIMVDCDSNNLAQLKKLKLQTDKYNVWLSVENGQLNNLIVRLRDSVEVLASCTNDTIIKYQSKTVRVREKQPIAKVYKYALWFSILILILIIIYVTLKLTR